MITRTEFNEKETLSMPLFVKGSSLAIALVCASKMYASNSLALWGHARAVQGLHSVICHLGYPPQIVRSQVWRYTVFCFVLICRNINYVWSCLHILNMAKKFVKKNKLDLDEQFDAFLKEVRSLLHSVFFTPSDFSPCRVKIRLWILLDWIVEAQRRRKKIGGSGRWQHKRRCWWVEIFVFDVVLCFITFSDSADAYYLDKILKGMKTPCNSCWWNCQILALPSVVSVAQRTVHKLYLIFWLKKI